MKIASESKQREILQLLKDYRAFHSPFGGARPTDETYIVDASYGPAGYVEKGREFEKKDVKFLRESYDLLRLALQVLRHKDFPAWMSLVEPYLADPADHSVVADWRKKIAALDKENAHIRKRNNDRKKLMKKHKETTPLESEKVAHVFMRLQLTRHDRAIVKLAGYLKDKDLFVIYPKRMTSQEETEIDRRNDELYRVYQELRGEEKKKTPAVKDAAAICGYSERRAWDIVKMREPERSRAN